MGTLGEIIGNIEFLAEYAPGNLVWVIAPAAIVAALAIPLLVQSIKTFLYMLNVRGWKVADGRIVKIIGKKSDIDSVIEYTYRINDTVFNARAIKNECKGLHSSMFEGAGIKVRVHPADYNKSEISSELSSAIVALIPVMFLFTLSYFMVYGFSGSLVSECSNNHDLNVPVEQTDLH